MKTRLERLAGQPNPDFCIYRNQPVLLLMRRWSGNAAVTFLAMLALLMLPRVIVTLAEGTIGPPGEVSRDLGGILFGKVATTAPSVPLLRDYADLAIIVLIAAHTAFMYGQWHRLQALPGRLRATDMLAPSLALEGAYEEMIGRYERRFNWIRLEVFAVVIAAVLALLLAELPRTSGIYGGLGASPSPMDRFALWWANPELHPVAYIILITSFWLYLYLVVRHTSMGVLLAAMFIEARQKAAKQGELWLTYPHAIRNMEPVEIVSELRQALYDVTISITLLVSAFLAANLYVVFPWWIWWALVLPYLLLNPLFVAVPTWELNRCVSVSWRRLYHRVSEREIEAELHVGSAPGSELRRALARVEVARAERERVERLPREVIRWRSWGASFAVYLAPVLLLVPPYFWGKA